MISMEKEFHYVESATFNTISARLRKEKIVYGVVHYPFDKTCLVIELRCKKR